MPPKKPSTRISRTRTQPSQKIRYAVVGLGYIAQVAVLPAFAHAKKNSELAAFISDDSKKLKQLGKNMALPVSIRMTNMKNA